MLIYYNKAMKMSIKRNKVKNNLLIGLLNLTYYVRPDKKCKINYLSLSCNVRCVQLVLFIVLMLY
jgi:hypothetical protein